MSKLFSPSLTRRKEPPNSMATVLIVGGTSAMVAFRGKTLTAEVLDQDEANPVTAGESLFLLEHPRGKFHVKRSGFSWYANPLENWLKKGLKANIAVEYFLRKNRKWSPLITGTDGKLLISTYPPGLETYDPPIIVSGEDPGNDVPSDDPWEITTNFFSNSDLQIVVDGKSKLDGWTMSAAQLPGFYQKTWFDLPTGAVFSYEVAPDMSWQKFSGSRGIQRIAFCGALGGGWPSTQSGLATILGAQRLKWLGRWMKYRIGSRPEVTVTGHPVLTGYQSGFTPYDHLPVTSYYYNFATVYPN